MKLMKQMEADQFIINAQISTSFDNSFSADLPIHILIIFFLHYILFNSLYLSSDPPSTIALSISYCLQ